MAPDATNPEVGASGSVDDCSLLASSNTPDSAPKAHAAQAKSLCILGIDPGLSGATAWYFPAAPDRVAAEDMPVVGGAVHFATLAAP
jgi:hypothetical protein